LPQIQAAKAAFEEVFGSHATIEVEGVKTDSLVKDQPTSDFETQSGALNRARDAMRQRPDYDFYVGVCRERILAVIEYFD
jgi:non-canonical (house-cleaning) NTP pyrophosphatase